MTGARRYLVIAICAVALSGVYWAVSAQEGPLFPAPPVFPGDGTDKKPAARQPFKTQPWKSKGKADATLIVPPEVYEVPRPVDGGLPVLDEDKREVVPAGGVPPPAKSPATGPMPAPVFPPVPEEKASSVTMPLPALEPTSPPAPMPIPVIDPTKVLIVDPAQAPAKDPPAVKAPPPLPPPVIPAATQPDLKMPAITPVAVQPDVKMPPMAPPAVQPDVKMPAMAPPPVLPPVTVEVKKPVPVIVAPEAVLEPRPDRPRAFVRIESAANNPTPTVQPTAGSGPPVVQPGPVFPDPRMTLPPPSSNEPGLGSLQTPTITVRKLGPGSFRAGETVTYSLVVRNLANVSAQRVRLEDELPADATPTDAALQIQGRKAMWVLTDLAAGSERVLQYSVRTPVAGQSPANTSVLVSTAVVNVARANSSPVAPVGPTVSTPGAALAVQVSGPTSVFVGKSAVFDIRVTNQSSQPVSSITLYGWLPDGLSHPEGSEIKGAVETTILPGESRTLRMPTTAVKAGRHTIRVKVATSDAEASATCDVDVAGATLQISQAPAARILIGRDSDLRIDVTNNTGKPLKNVAIADRLPDGIDFVAANERGLFQSNTRTVYWVLDQLPAGQTKSLLVRVCGAKAGQLQNPVFAKADGITEVQSSGVITLEGHADLMLRVVEKQGQLELKREGVYEIVVVNSGSVPATNVRLQVQFPAGLTATRAEGETRFTLDRQGVTFEPIGLLAPREQIVFRVSAVAQAAGDQRVHCAVTSEQVRLPVEREISVRVYP
jgi:uncharacterized repeat protein (TIGR01451 family)